MMMRALFASSLAMSLAMSLGLAAFGSAAHAQQPNAEIVKSFAPTGTLRVAVLMVTYFAIEDKASGALSGVIPDLGRELARRLGTKVELIKFNNPIAVIEAFKSGSVDVTFIGITADRAAAFDFGPVVLDLQTTYLVPGASPIQSIAEIDREGVRLLVPLRSAQEAHLRKTLTKATIINVAVENPKQAVEILAKGEADAFSHVVPMLVSAQAGLAGSRILPGSYYNVPIAIGYAKGKGAVADYARAFAEGVKASGFVQASLARAGDSVKGVVVGGMSN
jgi:polar amino acid transport system substrate-binding protein